MARSPLDPTALQRISAALRPDWARTVLARRIAAAILVLFAALLAFRPDPANDRAEVVVAARDLSPGTILSSDDVRLEKRSTTILPDGVRTESATLFGATLAGPVRRGEMLTDVRVLGPRLAESAAGKDARIVPVPLADAATVDMIRTGDVVDILTVAGHEAGAARDSPAEPTVLASGAVVVLVSPKPAAKGVGTERVVMVALPPQQANRVATIALVQAVTLTFR
ncbi:SAF domain-containing protein [Mycobacteroides abscessus]|uniref:SAF domain-containing protein n=1 Tax=Mycobacteroides abscessus TaxID=36809 RepID=UPI0009A57879|nr:SAF domain-containing protein [Mycobacteroides abscessus]MDO2968702.1 SAF domain-containing protein [Mycobacteroides abscessus subsp. bolletii]MDO3078708.1 SAF domain-containing protein [Mycobacteroides abscessus subsp. bolletii]SLC56628.1 flagellar basal body P-ring biosynthesis protein [Mycobacteroides abscessus subsp. bolletii]